MIHIILRIYCKVHKILKNVIKTVIRSWKKKLPAMDNIKCLDHLSEDNKHYNYQTANLKSSLLYILGELSPSTRTNTNTHTNKFIYDIDICRSLCWLHIVVSMLEFV